MPSSPSMTVHEISFEHPRKQAIIDTFFVVSDHLRDKPNPGACHLLSSIFYVLLAEQGIESELCIGEVKRPDGKFFDHSWVEIANEPFDIAIQLTYNSEKNPPVFAGYDLSTAKKTDLKYGEKSPVGLDSTGKKIAKQSVTKYLDGAKTSAGWGAIQKLSRQLKMRLDIEELREKYMDTQRKYISL